MTLDRQNATPQSPAANDDGGTRTPSPSAGFGGAQGGDEVKSRASGPPSMLERLLALYQSAKDQSEAAASGIDTSDNRGFLSDLISALARMLPANLVAELSRQATTFDKRRDEEEEIGAQNARVQQVHLAAGEADEADDRRGNIYQNIMQAQQERARWATETHSYFGTTMTGTEWGEFGRVGDIPKQGEALRSGRGHRRELTAIFG